MKKLLLFFIFALAAKMLLAQLTPEITSWIINTDGATGYNSIPSNVQLVQYSNDNVYVSCTCIPGYDIGPWQNNPNIPVNQNFIFKITRWPAQNSSTPVETPLGHIGVWSNGVSIYNAKDAMSYNNQGIWNQDALYWEGISFDSCLGHPAPNGEYHHHVNPRCLYDDADNVNHAPIIGYAFDGFPIYGAYGFTNTDGTGGIKRMESSWHHRNIADRTILPDGTQLTAGQYGPVVSTTYPLGAYIEDEEFISGSGDLDEHNGRYCVTPDYPDGIYAYFITIDSDLQPVFPYTVGPEYYGVIQNGNTGPGSGHNTISEPVTVYNPASNVVTLDENISFTCFPNPTNDYLFITINIGSENDLTARVANEFGQVMSKVNYLQPSITYTFDFSAYSNGIYFVAIGSEHHSLSQKITVVK